MSQNHFRMLCMRIWKECSWRTDISEYRRDLASYADEDSISWPTELLPASLIIFCCGLINFEFDNYTSDFSFHFLKTSPTDLLQSAVQFSYYYKTEKCLCKLEFLVCVWTFWIPKTNHQTASQASFHILLKNVAVNNKIYCWFVKRRHQIYKKSGALTVSKTHAQSFFCISSNKVT